MTGSAIPISPEALTTTWLTESLRDAGLVKNGTVTTLVAERIGEGEGVMSQIVRVRLQYDVEEFNAPRSLIAKFPTEAVDRFFVARLLRLYERESGFYSHLQNLVPMRTPRCYFNTRDPATDEFVLLLEDLAPATVGDQVAGCSVANAALAVEHLAAMHAAFWDDPCLDAFTWMPSWNDPVLIPFFTEAYRRAWREARSALPAELEAIGERLSDAIKPLLTALSHPPYTVLHGDFRVDNLFFTACRDKTSLAVIDWQCCARGRGVFDVAYFLSQSLSAADRRAEEMRLVARYHEVLVAKGVRGYSFADCLLDYRRGVLLGFIYPLVASQSMARIEVRGRELADTMLQRSMAAVVDLNVAELL